MKGLVDKSMKIGKIDIDTWLENIEDGKEQEVDLIKYETKVVAFLDLLEWQFTLLYI